MKRPRAPDQNHLIVFGSAALQLTVASNLLSADIDISLDGLTVGPRGMTTPRAEEHLRRAAAKVKCQSWQRPSLHSGLSLDDFQPANRWEKRAFEKTEGGWRLVYPHPYDTLFSKLRRIQQFQKAHTSKCV